MIGINDIYNFLFAYEVPSSFVACFRIIVVGYLLGILVYGFTDIWTFCSANGPFNHRQYLSFNKKHPQISIFEYWNSTAFNFLIFNLFFISGILSIIGLFTNLSLLVFLICLTSIQSRACPIIFSGGDSIARILVLVLAITDCGAQYSLDNYFGLSSNESYVSGTAIRYFQIYIAVSYFWAGFSKLRDAQWMDGVSAVNAIASHVWGRRLCLKYLNKKSVNKFLSYSVIFFDYFAPLLFFINQTRIFAIIVAIMMHLGITIFLRIGYFGPIMIIAIFSFCDIFFL